MDCKEAFATTIFYCAQREWVKNEDGNTRTIRLQIVYTIKDDEFWEDVENVLAITKPIFLLIMFCGGKGLKKVRFIKKWITCLVKLRTL